MFKLLKPLRERGVIFIGSGNLVHNLGRLNFHDDTVFDWAEEFDVKASEQMSLHNLDLLINPLKMTNAASIAVQFDDHYRPMLAAMALLDPKEELSYFNEVIELGSVGMRSFIAS
jgi:4,5-DOPA dioxygenase extradiol